jgi:hypothetical protein
MRALVICVHPDPIKAYGHERFTFFLGRRGKLVLKICTMSMARVHMLSKELQCRFGTTMSVI